MASKQVEKPIGTEHEYSINDQEFNPLPISDRIIIRISGALHHQVRFGEIEISKELQKHVIELIPARPGSLGILEDKLYKGLKNLYHALNYEYNFLGLGMHPLLKLDQTTYWDHDEQEYYRAYDKLFNLKQHGWMNIQALQINIPYGGKADLVNMYNRLRSLIPYVVAVSASSPFVEGRLTSYADNRLVFYRENQRRMPLICNDVLPERIANIGDYVRINKKIYSELRECGADVLCREWVNSRGVIVRFTRRCLEVKAIDEQECLRSDMAIAAFLLTLLRSDQELEEDENALRSLLEQAMMQGTKKLLPELRKLYRIACKNATREEKQYMQIIEKRIDRGSLAEVMVEQYREESSIKPLLSKMAESLKNNTPYF
ncbi:MAG: glutamate-cysteine ligase family protein [Methanotrichaceae archaeon]|nr:glutamate-cysteine ligase family protein [Methanotrichaceae archaeon]